MIQCTAHLISWFSLPAFVAFTQRTTEWIDIGGSGVLGCEGPEGPPLLDDGTPATSLMDVTCCPGNDVLLIGVPHTSPVIPGVHDPLPPARSLTPPSRGTQPATSKPCAPGRLPVSAGRGPGGFTGFRAGRFLRDRCHDLA